jgi:hypothetical protein
MKAENKKNVNLFYIFFTKIMRPEIFLPVFDSPAPSIQICRAGSNSEFKIPNPKRDVKNSSGVLSAGKIRGPHPRFFPPTPLTACFASLFAGIFIVNYLIPRGFQGKKWSNICRYGFVLLPVPLTIFRLNCHFF